MSDFVVVFQVIGEAVGVTGHLAPVVGGIVSAATLCGVGTATAKVAGRFFWIGNVDCQDCRDEYKEHYRTTVADWRSDEDES